MMEVFISGSSYLTNAVLAVLCLAVVLALIFPMYQNKAGRIGGAISLWKSIWLVYAIVLWLILPCFFVNFNFWWLLLACSMGLRCLIELPLCYFKKWKVSYGVTHDIVHMLLVIPFLFVFGMEARVWLWLTLVSLASELIFVYCFRKTGGEPKDGVYFVPEGKKYQWLNRLTACLLVPQLVVIGMMFVVR